MDDADCIDAKYSLLLATPMYAILLLNVSIGLILIGFSVHLLGRGGIYGVLVGFIWLLMWLYTLIVYFGKSRPLRITDRGIASMVVGQTWKFLAWTAVERIERIRAFDVVTRQYRHNYSIIGNSTRVLFNDQIDNLPALIAMINASIDQHKIPTFVVDRGRDTLGNLSPQRKGAELRELQRNGIRNQVRTL